VGCHATQPDLPHLQEPYARRGHGTHHEPSYRGRCGRVGPIRTGAVRGPGASRRRGVAFGSSPDCGGRGSWARKRSPVHGTQVSPSTRSGIPRTPGGPGPAQRASGGAWEARRSPPALSTPARPCAAARRAVLALSQAVHGAPEHVHGPWRGSSTAPRPRAPCATAP